MIDSATQPATRNDVEETGGAYRVAGSRISLDSVVWAFLDGQTAESIAQSFPALSLEQVYGALTFYLAHRPEIDAYLTQGESQAEALRQAARDQDPLWYGKLRDARRSVA